MNIKLDKDVRIRLDQEDVLNWKSEKYLKQQYKLGTQNIALELKSDPNSQHSYIVTEMDGLMIIFNQEDTVRLCNNSLPKSGITIFDINIQIDKWDTEKRNKYDDSRKGP